MPAGMAGTSVGPWFLVLQECLLYNLYWSSPFTFLTTAGHFDLEEQRHDFSFFPLRVYEAPLGSWRCTGFLKFFLSESQTRILP